MVECNTFATFNEETDLKNNIKELALVYHFIDLILFKLNYISEGHIVTTFYYYQSMTWYSLLLKVKLPK